MKTKSIRQRGYWRLNAKAKIDEIENEPATSVIIMDNDGTLYLVTEGRRERL